MLKKIITLFLIIYLSSSSFAEEKRQNVIQRTMEYSNGVDLVTLNNEMRRNFSVELPQNKNSSTSDFSNKCNGYTTSECGKPCCGELECKLICTENTSISHGDDMCLSRYTTSECGMSCCGKEDCENVCLNYRIEQGQCGNFTQTTDGQSCCGYEDCRKKQCGSYTTVTTTDGRLVSCCGKENCEKVACDWQQETTGQYGGTVGISCCGKEDCYLKECNGLISIDSIIDPNRTNIQCCGAQDCHNKACENFTEVQTPNGVESCCGYEDCHKKECQNKFYIQLDDGKKIACCGQKACDELAKCYTVGNIANCILRFEDAKDGVTAALVNKEVGNAHLYMGIVGDNYWGGWCSVYEHWTTMRILKPEAITKVTLEYAKWDDYLQVYIGRGNPYDNSSLDLIYEAPYPGVFPPDTEGACELSTSWETNPNIDVTDIFKKAKRGELITFKTRVSVAGAGQGYARLRFHYTPM